MKVLHAASVGRRLLAAPCSMTGDRSKGVHPHAAQKCSAGDERCEAQAVLGLQAQADMGARSASLGR